MRPSAASDSRCMSDPNTNSDASKLAKEVSKANTVSVTNTKLVAALDSLGFRSECTPVHDVSTGRNVREFIVRGPSLYPEFGHLRIDIVRAYLSGKLEAIEPMHPLCVAMRGQHNYDRVLDMQNQAQVMNLRSAALVRVGGQIVGGAMTTYRASRQQDLRTTFSPASTPKTSIALVAALGGVGLPVVDITGADASRTFWLPRFGYALTRLDGTTYLEDASDPKFEFDPTPQDPWRLALYVLDPRHPVSIAYNSIRSRVRLRDLLRGKPPRLHLKDGSLQAIVTHNYTGRVMEKLTQRFGSPPL
jgi:hypothetical protein